ncbi:hypothetical protein J437_LFUL015253 [Ladona fulva]|uniref:Uncharacterized protein n=1 Tax=Ladona fulva TaxID=123851 RepID=A0A8K0K7R5_LADFU|nr:hypothetical protein J437_LFUL015253 [Ladona fulva]
MWRDETWGYFHRVGVTSRSEDGEASARRSSAGGSNQGRRPAMPRSLNTSALMKPLVVLALPGMYLFYKYNQYKRQQQEQDRRKVTERELAHLNHKIFTMDVSSKTNQTSALKCFLGYGGEKVLLPLGNRLS